MKLMLDTHVLLWTISNDERLSPRARRLIEDRDNDIFYSVVCLWEVQIKHQSHPDKMQLDASRLLDYCRRSGFRQVSVQAPHVLALGSLERHADAKPHHDPFDRIMICQASSEGMLFLTHDKRLAEYTDPCVFAV